MRSYSGTFTRTLPFVTTTTTTIIIFCSLLDSCSDYSAISMVGRCDALGRTPNRFGAYSSLFKFFFTPWVAEERKTFCNWNESFASIVWTATIPPLQLPLWLLLHRFGRRVFTSLIFFSKRNEVRVRSTALTRVWMEATASNNNKKRKREWIKVVQKFYFSFRFISNGSQPAPLLWHATLFFFLLGALLPLSSFFFFWVVERDFNLALQAEDRRTQKKKRRRNEGEGGMRGWVSDGQQAFALVKFSSEENSNSRSTAIHILISQGGRKKKSNIRVHLHPCYNS